MSSSLSRSPPLILSAVSEDSSAVHVDGIGWIAQYHSWYEMQWEKGIPYFVRDYKTERLEALVEDASGDVKKRKLCIARLVAELNHLNSEIRAHENQRLLPLDVVRNEPRGHCSPDHSLAAPETDPDPDLKQPL